MRIEISFEGTFAEWQSFLKSIGSPEKTADLQTEKFIRTPGKLHPRPPRTTKMIECNYASFGCKKRMIAFGASFSWMKRHEETCGYASAGLQVKLAKQDRDFAQRKTSGAPVYT